VEKYFLEKNEAIIPALYLLKRGLSSFRSAHANLARRNYHYHAAACGRTGIFETERRRLVREFFRRNGFENFFA